MRTVKRIAATSTLVLFLQDLLNFLLNLPPAFRMKWIIQRIFLCLLIVWVLMVFIGFIFMFLPRQDNDQSVLIGFTDDSGMVGETASFHLRRFPYLLYSSSFGSFHYEL
jgi:hypothetical protein